MSRGPCPVCARVCVDIQRKEVHWVSVINHSVEIKQTKRLKEKEKSTEPESAPGGAPGYPPRHWLSFAAAAGFRARPCGPPHQGTLGH